MMQQVNLLVEDLRPRREALSLNQLITGWGALSALLVLVSAWQGVSIWRLEAQEHDRRVEWQAIERANAELRGEVAAEADPTLVEELDDLRRRFSAQAALVEAVRGYESRSERGFSPFLTDLAARQMDGMALSRIVLRDGGSHIRLAGETQAPVHVPRFLQSLSLGDSFRGHRFDELRLEEQASGVLSFDVVGPDRDRVGLAPERG